MFDIKSIVTSTESTLVLVDPETKEPVKATIELAGPAHPKRRGIEFKVSRSFRSRWNKTGKVELGDPEDDEAAETDKLVACTLSWSGFGADGSLLPCTPENVRELYSNPEYLWIREQVIAFLGSSANFLRRTGGG